MTNFQTEVELADLRARIDKALEHVADGSFDGAHHKMWAIDQILRALTGCPMVTVETTDYKGTPFTYETQGESDEYTKWVEDFQGEYDEDMYCYEYEWDTGIAP